MDDKFQCDIVLATNEASETIEMSSADVDPTTANYEQQPVSHEYLYVDYLKDFQRGRHFDHNCFEARCNRIMVMLLSRICNIDMYGKSPARYDSSQSINMGREIDPAKGSQSPPPSRWWFQSPIKLTRVDHSDWYKKQRFKWLSHCLLCLYFVSSTHVLINLTYQYEYDFNKMRLSRVRALLRDGQTSLDEFSAHGVKLLERIEHAREMLQLIGAPHRHLTIVIECLYIYILLFSFLMYYLCHLYYRLIAPFKFHFVCELLDYEAEQRHTSQLVERQLHRFMDSNRTFSRILLRYLDQTKCDASHQQAAAAGVERAAGLRGRMQGRSNPDQFLHEAQEQRLERIRTKLLNLSRHDHRIHSMLTQMLACGAFKPFNKSPDWSRRRTRLTSNYHVGILSYAFIFFGTLMEASFAQRDPSTSLSWPDLHIMLTTFALILLLSLTVDLCSTYFFVGTMDQIVIVNKVQAMIVDCIRRNSHEFQLIQRARSRSASDETIQCHVDKMNANYLFVLMHYKIFAEQFQAPKRTVQSVVAYCATLVLLIPIIIRLHMPYLNQLGVENVKWFSIALSFTILGPANLGVLPVCYLHARCVNLYRLLSGLVAHVVETDSHPHGRGLYDQHAVSLLLKELRHTEKFMERFKMRFSGLTGTYTTLVKTHFWWGIVVLSILSVDSQANGIRGQEMLSSLFNDPFGVFTD